MRNSGFISRRVGLTVAAVGLAGGAVLAAPGAQADTSAATTSRAAAAAEAADPVVARTATALANRLGARTAGAYVDRASGKLVVTVSDRAAAQAVSAAGATPKLVARSGADLRKATATLERAARITGTAWAVDPATNQIVVSVDSSVRGAKLARIKAVVSRLGGAARLETVAGTFTTAISGGQAIYGGGSRCSLGFNVRSGSTYFFLTAGHCTNIASTWYANSSRTTLLGSRVGSSFPGDDYGIVQYTNAGVSHPGNVYLYPGTQDITTAGNAYVGQSVRRSGSTTGVRGGTVTGLNATVNYAQGQVRGLIRTNVCAQPGDSGGSLFAGSVALGLTSGGSGNCTFGGTTFFQPVTEPLSVYGVNVY